MGKWFTRKRVIWLSIATIVALLLLEGLAAKPAHEVHTPGATALKAVAVATNLPYYSNANPASQSISDLRCQVARARDANTPCPPDIASPYLTSVAQSPNTLYLLWIGCIDWHGAGEIIEWQGYNIEFLPDERELVIHCYTAEPWIAFHQSLYGVAGSPIVNLLMVPTSSMGPGPILIVEDDRREHLVGDQSIDSPVGRAVIS